MKRDVRIGALFATLALGACSGSSTQQSMVPAMVSSSSPVAQSKLEFAVGTANIAGMLGLNTVVSLRQTVSNVGQSILSNAPTITGPAGFTVPSLGSAPDAYGDAGTNHISAFIPTSVASPPPQTTFDPDQGDGGTDAQGNFLASSWGFFPGVTGNSGDLPNLEPAAMPFYAMNNATLAGATLEYIGGPPAFVPPGHTSTQDGTFGSVSDDTGELTSNYPGFTLGITDFQATPVSGSYGLSVVVPTGVNTTTGVSSYGTKTTAATLASGTVLAPWTTAPTFVPDGTGGGTITTNFAGGAGITEEFVELVNVGVMDSSGDQLGNLCQLSGMGPYYYTFEVAAGTATVTVPDDIGAAPPGTTQPHTLCTATDNGGATVGEDGWLVYGFAVDYPLLQAGFPSSQGNAAPTITTTGQDDITTSNATGGPAASSAAAVRKMLQSLYGRHHARRTMSR